MRVLKNPNIIMIIIDAARADYFSCYGFPRATTPNIDKFAQQGILFENVISTAPWTVPAHGSIFTSLYPYQHGATWQTLRLRQGVPTIFDIFIERGYESVALSANSLILSPYNMFGKKTRILGPISKNTPDLSSFTGNFDYRETSSEKIADYFIQYLEGSSFAQPFIAYLNFYDLHPKYKAREPFYSRYVNKENDRIINQMGDFYNLHFKEMNDEIEITQEMILALRAFYAARLSMIDDDLKRLLDKAEKLGAMDNSIMVITSDHGDILGDHRKPSFHHQFSIYNSLLKVPLIFYCRDIKIPRKVETPLIQNTDIFPTLLELCGIERPSFLDGSPGVSLARYIFSDNHTLPRKYAFSMYEGPSRFILRNRKKVNPLYLRSLTAIQDEEYKLILSDKEDNELYHIKTDKDEKTNIAFEFPEEIIRLKKALSEIKDKHKAPEDGLSPAHTFEAEEKIVTRLKALGYIE